MKTPATIFAICLLFSPQISAQNFNLEGFEPVGAAQKNILNIHQSKVLQNEVLALDALLDFSTNTLSADFDNDENRIWIENKLTTNLSANLGLFDFFELGFSLPLTLNRKLNPSVEIFKNSKSAYLSEARLVGKIQLPLDALLDNIGIALLCTFYLPTNTEDRFAGLGFPRVQPRFVIDYRTADGHIFAVNLARQQYEPQRFQNLVDDGNTTLGMGAKFALSDTLALMATFNAIFSNQITGSEADTVLQFNREGWTLQIGGGVGVTDAPGIPGFRAITSVGYTLRDTKHKDIDGDGIKDDKCPRQAEDFDEFEDDDGCPEVDNDSDGRADGKDKCPNDPEDLDGFSDDDGCPDIDNDSDEVPDNIDDCPLQKGSLKNAGCPLESNALVPEKSNKDPQ